MGLLKTILYILGIVILLGVIVKFNIFGLGKTILVFVHGFGMGLKTVGEIIINIK